MGCLTLPNPTFYLSIGVEKRQPENKKKSKIKIKHQLECLCYNGHLFNYSKIKNSVIKIQEKKQSNLRLEKQRNIKIEG